MVQVGITGVMTSKASMYWNDRLILSSDKTDYVCQILNWIQTNPNKSTSCHAYCGSLDHHNCITIPAIFRVMS